MRKYFYKNKIHRRCTDTLYINTGTVDEILKYVILNIFHIFHMILFIIIMFQRERADGFLTVHGMIRYILTLNCLNTFNMTLSLGKYVDICTSCSIKAIIK